MHKYVLAGMVVGIALLAACSYPKDVAMVQSSPETASTGGFSQAMAEDTARSFLHADASAPCQTSTKTIGWAITNKQILNSDHEALSNPVYLVVVGGPIQNAGISGGVQSQQPVNYTSAGGTVLIDGTTGSVLYAEY